MSIIKIFLFTSIIWGINLSYAQTDNCPNLIDSNQTNTDNDIYGDVCDNCITIPNNDQIDSNNDGYGNACDPDLNNDNVIDFGDLPIIQNAFFSQIGNTNWNPDADFNNDNVVDFGDLPTVQTFFFSSPGPTAIPQNFTWENPITEVGENPITDLSHIILRCTIDFNFVDIIPTTIPGDTVTWWIHNPSCNTRCINAYAVDETGNESIASNEKCF